MNLPPRMMPLAICSVCSVVLLTSELASHKCQPRAGDSRVQCPIEMPPALHTHQGGGPERSPLSFERIVINTSTGSFGR
jgi:hypothetical protein